MALIWVIITLTSVSHMVSCLDDLHEPPIYVIRDSPQDLASASPARWNNHKFTMLQNHQVHISSSSLSSPEMDHSKADMYLNQPNPHLYHSYKFMGLQAAALDHSGVDHQARDMGAEERDELDDHLARQSKMAPRPGVKGASTKGSANRRSRPSSKRIPQRPEVKHSPGIDDAQVTSLRRKNSTLTAPANRQARVKGKNLVCYYGTWAVYRPDAGKYPVENIDPFLCTHVIYGFTGLSYDNMIKPLDPWNDLEDNYGKGAMKRFTNLKRINPDLKTLVAIGGWNEGSIKYSKMASDPEARATFVSSVVNFLAKYNFDGLDLDWEYPGSRGGASYDKDNFVRLLRELKEAFEPRGYMLTAAVSAGKWFIDPAYDIAQCSKYLDLINLMAYDYHGGWESKTGMNAPLFGSPKHDLKDEALLNVNWSVNYWLQNGAPREKIMLGVGSYGRSFTLDKASVNGINAPASQKGQAGPYTREPGSLGYNEICESFRKNPQSWTIVRDPDYLAPYAYNDRQWVGYDDMQSLALKTQYAKSMGLGGMMMWSIETDDFQGVCHNEKYPLLNTIRRVLDGAQQPVKPEPSSSGTGSASSVPPRQPRPSTGRPTPAPPSASTSSTSPGLEVEEERPASSTRRPLRPSRTSARPRPVSSSTTTSTTSTSTTTTTSTTTRRPTQGSGEFQCSSDGMFADPSNCRKFIRCVSLGDRYTMYRFDCAPGTAFNEQAQYCDYPYNVPGCEQSQKRRRNPSISSRVKAYPIGQFYQQQYQTYYP